MPIPGYDPEDIDEMLESRLSHTEIESKLTESELERYRAGEETLIDLLDEEEIKQVSERGDDSN